LNISLILQYPSWFLILCLSLGALYAFVLYYKNDFIQEPTTSQKRIFLGLAILRFIAVSIIAFFLLSPFIRSRFTDAQKPEIIVLQDVSQSVQNAFKAENDSSQYVKGLNNLMDNLSKDYAVKLYQFSNTMSETDTLKFSGKATDISNPLQQITNLYSNQNVGAMILASDGIYNQGANPVYNLSGIKFPVYTVALGDTVPKKDLKVEKVYHNQIVYLGDKFKIAVDMTSSGFTATTSNVSVSDLSDYNNPKKLYSEDISFGAEELKTREFILEATKSGVQRFRVQLNPITGEHTTANNYKDFFIDVLDSRQKILIVAVSPHPDIAALKLAAENNKNYEVQVKFISEIQNIKFREYNLVVLHQIPANIGLQTDITQQLADSKTAVLYILGSQSNLTQFNKAQNAIQIAANTQSSNDVGAFTNSDFSLFNINDNDVAQIAKMPPLAAPFGQYKAQATAKVLLNQKIAFDESSGQKIAVLAGEGIWRWRLYDFQLNKSHDFTNRFLQQVFQFLAIKEDKRPFKISLPKNIFNENEPVIIEGELYNESFQLVNQPEVKMMIKDADDKSYEYTFSRSGNGYRLEAGGLPVGNYTFTASTKLADRPYSFSGKFTVSPLQLEALNPVANHQLLYQISEQTGGQMFASNNWEQLEKAITENQNIKPVLYDTFKTDSLINLKWIFFLIVSLLSVEWFIRKYMGGY
jgi:hypothetical protein